MRESKTYERAVALNNLGFALIVERTNAASAQPRLVGTARVLSSDERRAERARFRARTKDKADTVV